MSTHTPADTGLDVVTGAFSYSGAAIARELQAAGRRVRTLTGHPERASADPTIEVRPLDFADRSALVASLEGATALYNTYWVRFAHRATDHRTAVDNTKMLFSAARDAGVERIVHTSITNPSAKSHYPYFRGKAELESYLGELGVPFAVMRPGILFGGEGVLLNNMAWLLRHMPVFVIGGKGDYRLRPIHIDDLARLAVGLGAERTDQVVDAVGPDRPTFAELVSQLRTAVGSRSRVVHLPGAVITPLAKVLGLVLRDVLLTRDEFHGMADGLADVEGPSTGEISLSAWIAENGATLGKTYANELRRHFRS